ncbi:RNA polymerase factor sigma-54 [Sphingomonas nostoxanthinifaciens]|uniref:RNA polymerase factor sigma-54 n=1 Tax=Sphingomonas nostoxanthinifaciens TaxID=2872652 RepID=UPI001CC20D16|nr:RNA polymerase factor sigma-54 [Sphingomonas nostoxanthinifaciens]UAK24613.1 RNA polymerase factor sigma-54 [Sphingomonas nostoxanthinifaciens]
MSLAPRLDLRQAQSLVMTPQLQQAIKLLALSNLELEGFLAEELEQNPLLATGSDEPGATASDATVAEAAPAAPTGETATADELVRAGDAAADAPLDIDYDGETFHQDSAADRAGSGLDLSDGAAAGERPDFDSIAADAPNLADHLLQQAGEMLDGRDLMIARHIVDLIDDAGYVVGLDELAARLDVADAAIERVLTVIQGFDPTGVGARSLAECIALQAREADRYDPAMACMIDHLDLLARGQIAQLRRMCDVDEEDFADMVRELRGYDPKPGLRYGGERAAPIVPDLFVTRTRAGWAIELNHATLPRLLIDRRYHAELVAGADDKAGKAWLADRLASANWLIKALDQRQRTIVRVATELVKQQEGFFRNGVAHLKPMTLRAVADAIGMHESTVSRVTSNKYLACDRGLYELKYFFSSGVPSGDGEAASAEAVKSHIGRMIAGEGQDVLSDDKLVDLLKAKGFDIARRTVAKYREAMGLGSSVQRRRKKALE